MSCAEIMEEVALTVYISFNCYKMVLYISGPPSCEDHGLAPWEKISHDLRGCACTSVLLSCTCTVWPTARASTACATQLLGCTCPACPGFKAAYVQFTLQPGRAGHILLSLPWLWTELGICIQQLGYTCPVGSGGECSRAPVSSPSKARQPRCCRLALGHGPAVEDPCYT